MVDSTGSSARSPIPTPRYRLLVSITSGRDCFDPDHLWDDTDVAYVDIGNVPVFEFQQYHYVAALFLTLGVRSKDWR
jgi:hypothetical protein